MGIIRKFYSYIDKRHAIKAFIVFIFFLLVNSFIYLSVSNISSGDDQWFHYKFAYLLRTQGWKTATDFQWIYFTNLSQEHLNYAVTLYHYALVPFTFFSDKIFGLKLAGVFFATITPTFIFYVFSKLNFKQPFLWTFALYAFSSYNFIWRTFIARNFILINGLILLEIYFIYKRKYWSIFAISIIHTWWHPATFWLVPCMAIAYEAVRHINQEKAYYRNMLMAWSGSLLGFFLFLPNSDHLYSQMNPWSWAKTLLSFFYQLNSGIGIRQGNEAYKIDFLGYVGRNDLVFMVFFLFVIFNIVCYVNKKNKNEDDPDKNVDRAILRQFIFLISIVFFLGTIAISVRFEDLFMPVLFLGAAVAIQPFYDYKFFSVENKIVKKSLAISLIFLTILFFMNRALDIRNSIGNDQGHLKFEMAGKWLRENTSQGDIIFNTEWGQFPRLFFFNDWNYYIIGIEPKSLYRYDQSLYWLWHNISYNGLVCEEKDCSKEAEDKMKNKNEEEARKIAVENAKEIYPIIKNRFKSQYVFFDENTFLRKELDNDKDDYELVYEDKERSVFIYKLK